MATTRLSDIIDARDAAIAEWGRVTRDQLLLRLSALGVHDRVRLGQISKKQAGEHLHSSVRYNVRREGGEITSVGISFARQGIFIEHGVGKHRPRNSAQANAAKKPWLSVVIPRRVEALADVLAEYVADLGAQELRLVVPGIIDTTVNK